MLLYRLLLLIKGTKAEKMLVGIAFLLLASFLSRYLEFYTLDWLIQGFWSQVVIVLIILFQPEVRRALARMGETSFFSSMTSAEELKSLEELVKASVALSNRRIGALIVIERDVSLADYIEIGVQLDAKVSKELILSIFHPTSPIHDGAIVIRGNRIISAGCFLPITLGAEMIKSFGTRHRAGIGITEETDAVAIIVSEETGGISVVQKELFKTYYEIDDLRTRLTELFSSSKKRSTVRKA